MARAHSSDSTRIELLREDWEHGLDFDAKLAKADRLLRTLDLAITGHLSASLDTEQA